MKTRNASPPASALSPVGGCVIASILLCVSEGAARKWLLPDSVPAVQALLYFSKDVPLGLAVLYALLNPTRIASGLSAHLPTVLFMGTALAATGAVIALDGLNPMGAVVTVRNGLALPWIAWILGRHLRGRIDIPAICHAVGWCAAFNALLGGMQFYLPAGHVLNRQTTEYASAIEEAGRLRASGTFSYIAGMADLCIFAAWAGAVLVGAHPRRPLGYLYVAAGLVCASAAMSRSGLLWGVALFSLVLASSPRLRWAGGALLVAGVLSGLFAGEVIGGDSAHGPDLHTAILARHRAADDGLLHRATHSLLGDLPEAVADVPFGVGLGRGQTGGQAKVGENAPMSLSAYEGEFGRVVYEIGIVGFLGIYSIRLAIPILLMRFRFGRTAAEACPDESVAWPTIWLTACAINLMVVFDHFQATYQAVALLCAIGAAERGARLRRRAGL